MRHFTKSHSPQSFEEWKLSRGKAATYKNIPMAVKKVLRESLMREQANLCCYCGISLNEGNVHIEHFKPQQKFPKQALKYENLHASCMGKRYIPSEIDELDFCGHAKKNWYDEHLLVSPLDPQCESYFHYHFDGGISGTNTAATETISQLHLSSYLLNTQRAAVIDGILETVDLEDTNEIIEWIYFLEKPDENGHLTSFSYIVARLLRSLVGEE